MATTGVQVLLVDDSPEDTELTLYVLRRENLANQIQVARDGKEALDFLFFQGKFAGLAVTPQPRLVLLDLKLPKLAGIEVLRQLKHDPRTRTIPVVILTSSREECDLASSYELGANSYIQKPVDFDKFRQTVKQLGMYWLVTNQIADGAGVRRTSGQRHP